MENKQFLEAEVKAQDDDKIVAVASTGTIDREGESLNPEGWDFKNYKKNGAPVLWSHDPKTPPIGNAKKLWIEGVGKRAKLMTEIVLHEMTDLARDIKTLVKEGVIKTLSVGFMPLEQDGQEFTKQELLEISFVPVPANPEAMVIAKDLDIDKKSMDILFKDEKSPACRMADETQDECVQRKIPELKREGMDQDQAVATAISLCKKPCDEKSKESSEELSKQIIELKTQYSDLVKEVKNLSSVVGRLEKESNQKGREGAAIPRKDRKILQIIDKSVEILLKKRKNE
jgi:HK97 family phage prohead protease